ncbi:hypothetical protein K474DRAFT_586338 [Panus rudis PR-1116 ss-1]|nr:hypothetical protein K474DRAFT_586338 [Panus rudis PR-1116 ss-1]
MLASNRIIAVVVTDTTTNNEGAGTLRFQSPQPRGILCGGMCSNHRFAVTTRHCAVNRAVYCVVVT